MLYQGVRRCSFIKPPLTPSVQYRPVTVITLLSLLVAPVHGEVISPELTQTNVSAAVTTAGSVSSGRSEVSGVGRESAKNGDEAARASLRLFESQGSGVKVQGLTMARTELNGRDVFAAQGGHALSWSDVSSEWMAGVDVHKLPDASMIEGGIGGTVSIRTHLPLQADAPSRAVTLGAQVGQTSERASPELSYLQSHQWQVGGGELGFLVNLVHAQRQRVTDSIGLEPFVRRSDLAERDVFVPRGVNWRRATHEQQQNTLASVLQWRPNSAVDIYWQSLYSHYQLQDGHVGAGLRDNETGLIAAEDSVWTYSDDGVFQRGSLWSQSWRGDVPGQGVRLNGTRRFAERTSQTWDNSLTFTLVPDAPWALRGDVQYVQSQTETLDFTVYTSTFVPGFELDLSGAHPMFAVTPSAHLEDSSNYFWNAAMDHLEDNHAELWAGRLDFAYQLPEGAWFSAWRVGARVNRELFDSLDSGYNWGSLSDIWNTPLKPLDSNAPEHSEMVHIPDFFDGEGPPVGFYLPSERLVSDFALSSELLPGIKSGPADEGWHPDAFTEEDAKQLQRDIHALYAMVQFDRERLLLWPAIGHVGLRGVYTETQSLGFGEYALLEDDTNTLDPDDLAFGNGQRFVLDETSEQTHWLPSAFVQFSLRPRLAWQVAASRTIARPSAHQLRSYAEIRAETETITLDNGDSQAVVNRWLGRMGNPQLEPIQADQLDTALQWQFGDNGRIYGALFHKTLRNSITTRVEEVALSNAGQTRPVEVESIHNVDGAHLRGGELGFAQKLGFLPGALRNIALETTYTHIESRSGETDSPTALPLEGLSRNNLSATGTYQNRFIKLTFAYRWRDDYLLSAIDVDTNRPTWHLATDRLDASLAWRLNSNLQMGVEAQNLTNSTPTRALGPHMDSSGRVDERIYANHWQRNERQWRLVMRGSF